MDNLKSDKILIGFNDNDIYIKAIGHITANVCFCLKDNLYKRIQELNPCFNVYLDMSGTEYMDSTFLGLLIGLEKRLYKNFNKHLYIINPSDLAMKHLSCFTLTIFLKIMNKNIPSDLMFKKFDGECTISDLEKLKFLLFSHENLSGISCENKEKFSNLEDYLREQIKNNQNKLS